MQAGGPGIVGDVALAVKNGTLTGGDGMFGSGDKCAPSGFFIG
jgi:hypothetical protein